MICLEEVLNRAGNNKLYAKIKERSALLMESLKNQFVEAAKAGELVQETDEEETLPENLKPLVEEAEKKLKESTESSLNKPAGREAA